MVFESIDNLRDDVAFYGKQIRRDIRHVRRCLCRYSPYGCVNEKGVLMRKLSGEYA